MKNEATRKRPAKLFGERAKPLKTLGPCLICGQDIPARSGDGIGRLEVGDGLLHRVCWQQWKQQQTVVA